MELGHLFEQAGIKTADLSHVEKPKGRFDYLAARLLEAGVRSFAPGLMELHEMAKPVIHGQLQKRLKNFKLPFLGE